MNENGKLNYLEDLIFMTNQLIEDLVISNPEYRTVFDVGNNPVILRLSSFFGYNPLYFAKPTNRGAQFDVSKIKLSFSQLSELKDGLTKNYT